MLKIFQIKIMDLLRKGFLLSLFLSIVLTAQSATAALLTVIKSGTGSGTVTSAPSGIDCGLDCSEDYAYIKNIFISTTKPVALTSKPDAGSTFIGWSGACTGTGTCLVTRAKAAFVTAIFTLTAPPKTGQTISYFAGDDGAIQAGVPWPNQRFTLNASDNNKSVTDNLTGLVWATDAGTPAFGSCSGGKKTWQGALDYLDCLRWNNPYLGYSDWRLPNVNELKSMISAGQGSSAAWLNTLAFSNVQADDYWSSTTYDDGDNFTSEALARYVNMRDDYASIADKSSYKYAWAVRSSAQIRISGKSGNSVISIPKTGQWETYNYPYGGDDGDLKIGAAWPNPRFTPNAADNNDTLTDNLTGLVWISDTMKPSSGPCVDRRKTQWQIALDYVDCLNRNRYLDHSDWRLPNVNELESMISAGQSNAAVWLNSLGFSNVQASEYWSSTTSSNNTDRALIVHMDNGGHTAEYSKSYNGYAWPVRSGQGLGQ